MNLVCLRNSKLETDFLQPNKIHELFDKYRMGITLGDQVYLTMLGWEHPQMFHVLDCRDNLQRSLQYLAGYIRDGDVNMQRQFIKYNYCALQLEAKICISMDVDQNSSIVI